MKFKDYIKDRIAYIVVYFSGVFISVLIMYLALIINKKKFLLIDAVYAFLVAAVFFAVFIIYDYGKNRAFYRELNDVLDSKRPMDYIVHVGNARSREQKLYEKILQNLYKNYGNDISLYEEKHEQYIYFINQWVHQMKTPVSIINLLLEDSRNDQMGDIVESISEENEKISRGLDMMLCNARLSRFNLDFNVESTDIVKIIRKVVNENKKSLIRYHIFPKIICDKTILVETDRKWIAFVINQILINAVKYSKAVEKKNKAIVFKIVEEESKVTLSIKDSGIGIPEEDLGRVFNAFFTGKNGRKTSESTGMGMYLSKRICDKLSHGLFVTSKPGEGAEFSIVFYRGKNIFKL